MSAAEGRASWCRLASPDPVPTRYAAWALTVAEMCKLFGVDRKKLLRLAEAGKIPKPMEVPAPDGARQLAWVQSSVRAWWTNERSGPLPALLRDPLPETVPSLETHPAPIISAPLRAAHRQVLNKGTAAQSVLKRRRLLLALQERQR